jgi:hypothetical protein
VNLTSRVSHRWARPIPAPAALLGAEHPLVRDLDRLAVAVTQLLVVAAVIAAGVGAVLAGSSLAVSLSVAAAVTEVPLAFRAAVLVESRRAHVLELISLGHADLPIPAVARVCVRLCRASHRRRLVRSIETLMNAEVQHCSLVIAPWQFANPDRIASIRRELLEIAALLREDGAGLAGIALMDRLLFDGTSSLHRDDVLLVCEELRRARFLLAMGLPRGAEDRSVAHT